MSNEVFRFDHFKKEWSEVESMRTPRLVFACSVISGKVYVAGGRNVAHPNGMALAEVYDPSTDKWEELPPMHNTQLECKSLSYNGKLYVFSDRVGRVGTQLRECMTEIFDPAKGLWQTQQVTWPCSWSGRVALQVTEDGRLHSVVDTEDEGVIVKTRDTEKGEWYVTAQLKSAFSVLPNHPHLRRAFDYGFAASGNELYIVGGRVLLQEGTEDSYKVEGFEDLGPLQDAAWVAGD